MQVHTFFQLLLECSLMYQDSLPKKSMRYFLHHVNWTEVVKGAEAGVESSGLDIVYNRLLLNEVEDPQMWWNGLYIMVVKK